MRLAMQCRFPHLCKLRLLKLLFRRCLDRKTHNDSETCKVRDSAIGERGEHAKMALVDDARDYRLLLSFLTDIYLLFLAEIQK